MKPAPSVVAVHDLSCVGRCALTVVIPVLAAMGIQPCPLPTAVLSTHTGGYTGMAVSDLTGFMAECVAHWKTMDIRFDAIYSGYLADSKQAAVVSDLIAWQREIGNPLVVVDPVMGDGGELYHSMPKDMPREMRTLCAQADLITPNLTEVSLLTGLEYAARPLSEQDIRRMIDALGAWRVMLTSVQLMDGRHANIYAERDRPGFWRSAFTPVPTHYPGTGDLFASVVTGAMIRGISPELAMAHATRYLMRVVEMSHKTDSALREGVQLEAALKNIGDFFQGEPPEHVL